MKWPSLIQKKKKNPDVSISLYGMDEPLKLSAPNYYGVKNYKGNNGDDVKKKKSDDEEEIEEEDYWNDAYIRDFYGDR